MTTMVLRRALRHPLVHFAAIGGILFVAQRTWRPDTKAARETGRAPIFVGAAEVRRLRTEFEQRWGGPPTHEQTRALVERTIEEEMLAREARALALDFGDGSVRRRLIEKARALGRRPGASADELYADARALGLDDDVVIRRLLAEKMRLLLQDEGVVAVDDAQLLAYLERNRARFLQPGTVSFAHVFLSRSRHAATLEADAAQTRAALGSEPTSAEVAKHSDPFPLGTELRAYTAPQLLGRFGKSFADAVLALEPGRWSEPIASPYGLHLVWVRDRTGERLPSLADVREAVTQAVMKERAAANLERGLRRLRALYEIRVDGESIDVAGETAPPRGPAS